MDQYSLKWHFFGGVCVLITIVMLVLKMNAGLITNDTPSHQLEMNFQSGSTAYTIYHGSIAVGSVQVNRNFEPAKGYHLSVDTALQFRIFEQGVEIVAKVEAQFDLNMTLEGFRFSITSDETSVEGTGVVTNRQLVISFQAGTQTHTLTLPYDKDLFVGTLLSAQLASLDLKPGETRKIRMFDPLSQTTRTVRLNALEREELWLLDRRVVALKIEQDSMGIKLNSWIDPKGTVLRQELGMGLVAQLEPLAVVRFNARKNDGLDLAQSLLIPVTNMPSDHENRQGMRFRISNLPKALRIRQNGRQIWQDDQVEISQERLARKTYFSPSDPLPSNDEFSQSEAPEIRSLALKLATGVNTVEALVELVFAWLEKNIEQKSVASLPAATETLRTRVGDCNEHAFLFAGLMRSVGIETRVLSGIVYVPRFQRFGYHAWNEIRLGDSWVSVDPTWRQFPADSTHLIIAKGGLQAQTVLWGLMGRLKVEHLQ